MEKEPAFREHMQETVDRQAASTKSPVISAEKYDTIKSHLLDPSIKVDSHFRHWVKTRNFQIVDLPGLGLNQVLVIPNAQKIQVEGSAKFLRVVHADNVFDVVKGIHVDELKHSGYKKVMDYVQRHYFGVTRGFIQEFCKQCPVCQLSQPQVTRPPLRPIIQTDFLERVQVDLIDMRHSPDEEYNYIGHFMDHFSKYHVLFPLKQKTAEEVARLIEERVLAYFGPPNIFHSDNGREFVNQLIKALFERWGGDTTFVNGRPRHSQSQGLVERGNRTVEKKIAAMKQEEKIHDDALQYPWASWLPRIQFSMNCARQETIKDAPYHVVFGRSVPAGLFPGAKGCFEEEDIGIQQTDDDNTTKTRPIPAPLQSRIKLTPAPRLFKPSSSATEEERITDQLASPSSPQPSSAADQPASPQPSSAADSPQPSSAACQPASQSPPSDPDQLAEKEPSRHSEIRKRALDNTYISDARMSQLYNRRKRIKVQEFSVGDRVSVAVPKLDRTATDLLRIPAIVSAIHGSKVKTYSLTTSFGVINTKFTGGDLQTYTGDIVMNNDQQISLREAAIKFHPENRFLKKHCSCSGSCKTDKCTCRVKKIKCSTHCHPKSTCANREETSSGKSKSPPTLSPKDRRDIKKKVWLNDRHMSAANDLLKKEFPSISGLEDTVLQQNNSFAVPIGEFAQFLHVNDNHWITISNIGTENSNTVCVYDSLRQQPTHDTIKTIAKYVHCREDQLVINVMNVDQQPNAYDCGAYAIAFATTLLFDDDPTELAYDTELIRLHFAKCIDDGQISRFPAKLLYRQPKVFNRSATNIYCDCRCPNAGDLMVECEGCAQWFYWTCLNLTNKSARQWKRCDSCLCDEL